VKTVAVWSTVVVTVSGSGVVVLGARRALYIIVVVASPCGEVDVLSMFSVVVVSTEL